MAEISSDKASDYGWAFGDEDDVQLSKAKTVILLAMILLTIATVWAYFAMLEEVSTGAGRVVPIRREQVIQSLEGGIVSELFVRENQIVETGQLLAQLDPTITESDVGESSAKYRASLAAAARLTAEINRTALTFPTELNAYPDLIRSETQQFEARTTSLEQSLEWMEQAIVLAKRELEMSESLAKIGAASNVEIIRLKRELVDLEMKKVDIAAKQNLSAREELAKANSDITSLSSTIKGRSDSLQRLTHRSPVRGIVKNIEVSTIGGVVPPNGKLMDIIPLDDELLIETRISPRDIAFIHPDQRASVKISAYDYAVYGGLEGRVTAISPDTMRDEVDPNTFYYRVFVQTTTDALVTAQGTRLPIVPGMVATVDVNTGSKSVLDYLIKPFNKAREALRER
ncbi:HlyD family efflux transporter periplasmic adaptor subunit [Neorhizobium sp. DAR64860/K0K1]|uniref:HlyD family efflux transporter periplasmic adaptor subunit n=1 Tax=Neorhizobium sp. DAR64860/K0K1 TaxID=3421955 RepID=UPI003D29E333